MITPASSSWCLEMIAAVASRSLNGRDQNLVGQHARDAMRIWNRLREWRRTHRPLIAHHRVVVHPVVRAFELQDFVAPAVHTRQPQGKERRLATATVQAHHLRAGHVLDDFLAECDRVLVDDQEGGSILGDRPERLQNGGVRVSEHVWPRAEQVSMYSFPLTSQRWLPLALPTQKLRSSSNVRQRVDVGKMRSASAMSSRSF